MKTLLVLLPLLSSVHGFLVKPSASAAVTLLHSYEQTPRPSLIPIFLESHSTAGKDATQYTIPLEQISLSDLPKVGGYVKGDG
jgi:hypothetical protein